MTHRGSCKISQNRVKRNCGWLLIWGGGGDPVWEFFIHKETSPLVADERLIMVKINYTVFVPFKKT